MATEVWCLWWLWCGRCACMTCLSMPHSSHAMNWVAGHLGVRARRPLLRPDGGGQTLALCLCTGPYQITLSMLHETCSTRITGTWTTSSMNCNWGITVVCLNSQDQGNLPLRHDRDVNDIRPSNELTCTGGAAQPAQLGRRNLIELQLWTLHGHKDHGDRPLHHDRNVNDLDELQLRKTQQISAV